MLANLAAVLRRRGSVDEVTEDDWDFSTTSTSRRRSSCVVPRVTR
ncbi:MAG: hypothetical protein U0667_11790 [Chloroflexota bacterium]